MKNRKFFLYLLFFILLSKSSLFSQELSNFVFSYLKNNGYKPVTQNLVNSGTNSFPFNIIQTFNTDNPSGTTLLLIFNQEDVSGNEELLGNFLSFLNDESFDFNITILFSFGEKQKIDKQGMIFGTECYIGTINTSNDITAIYIDLQSEKNIVKANSNGITAPAWLIKNTFDAFMNSNISGNLPVYYLSQMYKLNFFYDRVLSDFYKNDIPAIKLCFNSNTTEKTLIKQVLVDSVNKFSKTQNKIWDQHFLMVRHLKSYINISEIKTIYFILVIILFWLFFILILIFVNVSLKRHAWEKIKKIWYIVPLTFIIIILSFYEGKLIFNLMKLRLSDAGRIYYSFATQIFIAFFNASIFYLLILIYNIDFEARSIDFLIVISCFINQSLFMLVDISLFPIFMVICILSILALITRNNILHISLFILMILIFIPYLHDIITFADISLLKNFILSNPYIPFTFALVLYPIFLVDFRIITFYRNLTWNKYSPYIGSGSSIVIIFITLLLISTVRSNQITKKLQNTNRKMVRTTKEELIDFNYYDKNVFTDTIRTINIKIKKKPVQCDVTIIGAEHSPILYTDNDYENISQNTVFFKIPYEPPLNMNFTYGTQDESCYIKITAIFENEDTNDFTLVTKMVALGE